MNWNSKEETWKRILRFDVDPVTTVSEYQRLRYQLNAPIAHRCGGSENDLSRSRIKIVKKHSLGLSTPIVCLQCKEPPCSKACPVNAIMKDSKGWVKIDGEQCIGC